jgi:hypothetical protein
MQRSAKPGAAKHYRIRVYGRLDEAWSEWFDGLTITYGPSTTTLTGVVADQAALRGVLHRLWDLNLVLHSVQPAELEREEE